MPTIAELLDGFCEKSDEEREAVLSRIQSHVNFLEPLALDCVNAVKRVTLALGLRASHTPEEEAMFLMYLAVHAGDLRSVLEKDGHTRTILHDGVKLLQAGKFKESHESAADLIWTDAPMDTPTPEVFD